MILSVPDNLVRVIQGVISPSVMLESYMLRISQYFTFDTFLLVAVNAVPPEQLYASQLSQLQEMGFFDAQENIRALSAVGGNVHAAVERLLGGNLG